MGVKLKNFTNGLIYNTRLKCALTFYLHFLVWTNIISTSLTFSNSIDEFYFEVRENSKPNTLIGKITTKPGFVYRFSEAPSELSLDPDSGAILTTNVILDRELRSLYHLVILSSSPTYPIEVKIKVLDENDNEPYWPTYVNTNLTFSESAPIGTKVILESAIDLDEGYLRYQINHNQNIFFTTQDKQHNRQHNTQTKAHKTLPFTLTYNNSSSFLHLQVSDRLDRETDSVYHLNISAIDEGFKSSSIIFNIHILDSNDNPPLFDQSEYSVSINESAGKGVSILQVHASDADEEASENSAISYYLLSNEFFNIDPKSGIIFTSQEGAINCGTKAEAATKSDYWKVCVFTVFAHDHGIPRQTGRAYVTAKIYDSNNHSPNIKFRYFSRTDHASIDENAANGSVVAAVSVVDLDHGANGATTLEIANGNEFNHFRLESIGNSHIIRVNGTLDREKISRYNLTITAYDHGSPTRSSSAYLIVAVNDKNEHAPSFNKDIYEVSICESQQIGMFVTAIQAIDLDEGINSYLYYSLSGQNSDYFKIDSDTGLITTDKALDREKMNSFELKITARDSGSNPKWANALLKVKVLDINDVTPSIGFPSSVKYENQSKSHVLEIDENSILDITLMPFDNDLASNGTVNLKLLYNYNGLFEINESSKRLISTRLLDYEECNLYKLSIVAKDRGFPNYQLSSTTTLFIRVLDKDDIPPIIYPTTYFAFIPANFKSLNYSIVVTRILVRDADLPTPINFNIHSHDLELASQLFTLNRKTGEIKLSSDAGNLNNKRIPTLIKFNVTCHECQKGNNLAQINIFVINTENSLQYKDNIIREYRFRLAESVSIGTLVGNIEIDVNKFRLHLISGDKLSQFTVVRNAIKTNRMLDREETSHYKLQLVAANEKYFFHIEVLIEIIDVNDCHPVFLEKYAEIEINEDAPPKFPVFRLTTLDADVSKDATQFYLQNTNSTKYILKKNPFDLFMISGNQIKLQKKLSDIIDVSKSRQSNILDVISIEIEAIDPKVRTASSQFNAIESHETMKKENKSLLNNDFTLFIHIKSVHRFKPRFLMPFVEISIKESIPVNEQFYQVHAVDDDGDIISYQITSGNVNEVFGIFPDGNLFVRKKLDREEIDVYSLRITAFEVNRLEIEPNTQPNHRKHKENVDSIDCQILVHLIDVNDNRPHFTNDIYYFELPENSPINTLIGQVNAIDMDIGSNSEVYYRIIHSNNSYMIDIDAYTGHIWSKIPFDREIVSSLEFAIEAFDLPKDSDKLSSTSLIRINILDVNDNPPVFSTPFNIKIKPKKNKNQAILEGDINVSEDLAVNSIITTLDAIDVDSEKLLRYSISNQTPNLGNYMLNKTSGELVLIKELDREMMSEYKLVVEVNDGKYADYLRLNIHIDDVNDCAPIWSNFSTNEITIAENITIGSKILPVNAIDLDIGVNGMIRYEILPISARKYFDIINQSLVIISKLDYETQKFHKLNLTAIDGQGLKSQPKELNIIISDVNDCFPIFTQQFDSMIIQISESVQIGEIVLNMKANDCDDDDQLAYKIVKCEVNYQTQTHKQHLHSILHSNEFKLKQHSLCPFVINSTNGDVINTHQLNREVIESVKLHISVEDNAQHSDHKKIVVLVEDVNDEKPVFISPNAFIQFEPIKENHLLGTIEAIDFDMGSNSVVSYRAIDDTDDNNIVHLDTHTGQLYATKPISTSAKTHLKFNIIATDGGGLTSSDTVSIIILPATFVESNTSQREISLEISENEPIGLHITKLKCEDSMTNIKSPSNKDCEFHIVNATDRTFAIDYKTGDLYSTAIIDREMRDKYVMNIMIINNKSLTKVKVTVSVMDQNDNPPHILDSSNGVHISEAAIIGTTIVDLSNLVTDADLNDNLEYQLINCSTCDMSMFYIDKQTGIIKLMEQLDREIMADFKLSFGVSDGIHLTTSVLNVFVEDDNDNPPYFNASSYFFNLFENVGKEEIVGQIFAFDDDISSQSLTYRIVESSLSPPLFIIDTKSGKLFLSRPLDYEKDIRHYTIHCEANDGKFRSQQVKVIFNLLNVNDNPPLFSNSSYIIELFENERKSKLLCVQATDSDMNEGEKSDLKITYHFDSDDYQSNFEIDSMNGCISAKTQLDREIANSYELVVVADDGVFRTSATVQVRILDVNDNSPVFVADTPTIIKINENAQVGELIYTFKAIDADDSPNNEVTYEIYEIGKNKIYSDFPFTIGETDGTLRVKGDIDREKIENYRAIICAKDGGLKSSEIKVLIEVVDVNDNTPHFSEHNFNIELYENASVDSRMIHLKAIDADQSDKIYYKIISGDINGHFKIEEDYLVVAMKLDYEKIRRFDLKIYAIDKGGNFDVANVKIDIMNVIDEAPIFINSPYIINWCENEIGIVGRFEAHGETSNNQTNKRINYLLKNNYEQNFSLNSSNAVLSVIKPFDRETMEDAMIELRIIAIDYLHPQLTGEGIIYLSIFDVNDNEPHFYQDEYKILLVENQVYYSNEAIGKVAASDPDYSDNITYYMLENKHNQRFRIDENSGKIYPAVDIVFDREDKEYYELDVIASDSTFIAQTKVYITINDVNDCKPTLLSINGDSLLHKQNHATILFPYIKLLSLSQEDVILFGVNAHDCDKIGTPNSKLYFNLTNNAKIFQVNSSNGIIYSSQELLRKESNNISLELTITDSSLFQQQSSKLNIDLRIIRDNSYRQSKLIKNIPDNISVSEITKPHQMLYQFESYFQDISIKIIGGDAYDQFAIDKDKLRINKELDFEQIRSYHIYFEVIRKLKNFQEFQRFHVKINVLNENDIPPEFEMQFYNVSVMEEIEEPILVTKVVAIDKDSDGELLEYKIINNGYVPFKIDKHSGEIWTTSKIDRENNSKFDLIVTAVDKQGLSSTCKVLVMIDDKNDNPPRFTRLFSVNITENAMIGTFVVQVTSSDKDYGLYAKATYNFLEHSEAFRIDAETGKVFVSGKLDREIREEYLLMVSAKDGSWIAHTTLTINILDQNDCFPVFEKKEYEFNRGTSSSSIIGQVKATDDDKGNNAIISYSFRHNSQYFSINPQTGEIILKEAPRLSFNSDLRFLNRHILTVVATDKGQLPKSSETSIIINILPLQNDEIMLEHVKIKIPIPYDLKNQTLLYITSSILRSQQVPSDILVVKSNEIIFFGESLVKPGEVYNFLFTSVFERLEIELLITGVNVFTPVFINSQSQVNISENTQINEIILQVKASDNDTDYYNNLVSYDFHVSKITWNPKAIDYLHSINGPEENSNLLKYAGFSIGHVVQRLDATKHLANPFFINSTNGLIGLKNHLDYEIAISYVLTIVAYDNAWLSKNTSFELEVGIMNADDNSDSSIVIVQTNRDMMANIGPDPMSIGVILVITFFIILILVISTSFIMFHEQKKNQMRSCNNNNKARKLPTNVKHHHSMSSSPPSSAHSTLVQQQQASSLHSPNQSSMHMQMCSPHSASSLTHQLSPSISLSQSSSIPPPPPPPLLSQSKLGNARQPDIIEAPHQTSHSHISQRMPPGVPTTYARSNHMDNYSDMLAPTEHYDLENASSIAPSDIDFVYHYKGFRRENAPHTQHRHVPLARLSPSVSELSSVPRILTLQDLCPQATTQGQPSMITSDPKSNIASNDGDDDDDSDNTDDSFTCSENYENYELSKQDKDMIFERVW